MKFGPLPPKDKTIIPPTTGWKERTYYTVEVSFSPHNLIHRSVLFVGFIPEHNKEPLSGGYTKIMNGAYEYHQSIRDVHYLKVISEIKELSE